MSKMGRSLSQKEGIEISTIERKIDHIPIRADGRAHRESMETKNAFSILKADHSRLRRMGKVSRPSQESVLEITRNGNPTIGEGR